MLGTLQDLELVRDAPSQETYVRFPLTPCSCCRAGVPPAGAATSGIFARGQVATVEKFHCGLTPILCRSCSALPWPRTRDMVFVAGLFSKKASIDARLASRTSFFRPSPHWPRPHNLPQTRLIQDAACGWGSGPFSVPWRRVALHGTGSESQTVVTAP